MNLLLRSLACAAMVALCAGATAPTELPERTTVSFSDPSRPGELHVGLVTGNIVVKGADVKQVTIETHARSRGSGRYGVGRSGPGPSGPGPSSPGPSSPGPSSPGPSGPGQFGPHGFGPGPSNDPEEESKGLRRLTQQPAITVEEQNNRMNVSASVLIPADLEIQVPRHTNLELSTVNDGEIRVEGVDSELEIGNVNGSITLTGVGGSVVAHTVNGRVVATLTRISPQKPMAFSSLNGAVDVALPANTKANLKLRTDNGSVFTDFDLHTLPQSSATAEDTRQWGGRYRVEVNKVIYGTINGGGPEIEFRTFNGNIYVRKGS